MAYDDIESYWEGLRPRREPDPPMTEERRRAIIAGRQLGKSMSFLARDLVRDLPMSRPSGPMVRFEGQIYQNLSDDEVDGLVARGGTVVPVRGLTEEELDSAELVGEPIRRTLTYEEQEQLERHSILNASEGLSQEDLDASALRIRRIREVESRRARGLPPIPLAVAGYSIQPHETLEEFAIRAQIAYPVDTQPADEARIRAWEDRNVLHIPRLPPAQRTIGNMTPSQVDSVNQLFQEWIGLTEEQQNWFQDQVALARGNQPINRTALEIGTTIHMRIEAAVREATQGFVADRSQMYTIIERAVREEGDRLLSNQGVRGYLEHLANQIDLQEVIQQAFPEDEPLAPLDFGDLMRGPVRNPNRS